MTHLSNEFISTETSLDIKSDVIHQMSTIFPSVTILTWFRDLQISYVPPGNFFTMRCPNSWKAETIDQMFGNALTKTYGRNNFEIVFPLKNGSMGKI